MEQQDNKGQNPKREYRVESMWTMTGVSFVEAESPEEATKIVEFAGIPAEQEYLSESHAVTDVQDVDATVRLCDFVKGRLGIDLNGAECRDVLLMLRERDEDSLLEFFGDHIDGGLTREGCIAVSDLLADFGGYDDEPCPNRLCPLEPAVRRRWAFP